jgi:hypothetical protein
MNMNEGIGIVGVYHDAECTEPGFFYTSGLHGYARPELLLIGSLPEETANHLIWSAVSRVMEWGPPTDGAIDRELSDRAIAYRHVDKMVAVPWMSATISRYQEPVETVQLIWPDSKGRFPWHRGNKCQHAQSYLIDFSQEMRQ